MRHVQRRELARSLDAAQYELRLMTEFADFLDNHLSTNV